MKVTLKATDFDGTDQRYEWEEVAVVDILPPTLYINLVDGTCEAFRLSQLVEVEVRE